jgi:hypothetical protein
MSSNFIQDRLSEEAKLLLCCTRTRIGAEKAERIKALAQQDMDWPHMIRTAYQHRVMPLLYQSLTTTCPESIPKAILNELKTQYQINLLRNMFLTRVLFQLLDLFKENGISAVPFKGPVLSAMAYRDLSLRQFSDLDILIHKRDIHRAKSVLVSQGYHPMFQRTAQEEAFLLQSNRAYPFVRDDGRVAIDLQWSIALEPFSFPRDPECLWENLKPFTFEGRTVYTFPLEDLLPILCVHGAKHIWNQLLWISDIAELIDVCHETDWKKIRLRAQRLGDRNMLLIGVCLASRLFETTLPENVVEGLQAEPKAKLLARRMGDRLFSERRNSLEFDVELWSFHLRMKKGTFWDRVRYPLSSLQKLVTPNQKDKMFLRLPQFLSFFYYVLRPIRLFREYGRQPLEDFLWLLCNYIVRQFRL